MMYGAERRACGADALIREALAEVVGRTRDRVVAFLRPDG
jgi:hypothetical protein